MLKNVNSQKWTVFAFDITDNTPKTGDLGQITGSIWVDGAENVIGDANPTELAHGYYEFDLDQAETNGDYLVMDAVSSTGNIQVIGCPAAVWTTETMRGTDSAYTGTPPTVTQIQAEMEEDGGSLLDTIRDELANGDDGLTALKAIMDTSGVVLQADQGVNVTKIGGTATPHTSGKLHVLQGDGNAITAVGPTRSEATTDKNTIITQVGTTGVALLAGAVDDIWDEVLTGSIHNIATSAGRRVRTAGHDEIIARENTCQGGENSTHVKLDGGASGADGFYDHMWIYLNTNTGAGQVRIIDSYVGSTFVAEVHPAWLTNPDATTTFTIMARAEVFVHDLDPDALASVNAEVDKALNTVIPGSPEAHSINERIKTLDDHDLVTKIPGVVTAVGPTKDEMDTAHGLLATPAQVATALTNYDASTGTEIGENKTILDKLDSAMVADGEVHKFTENALEDAPSGTGGDATATNQETIITALGVIQTDLDNPDQYKGTEHTKL